MNFYSVDAFKKSLKKKETKIKKGIVEVWQQASYHKLDWDDEILGFVLGFDDYNNTDFKSFAVTGCFQKLNLQGFNFLYQTLSFHQHSCMCYVSYWKNILFYMKIIVFQWKLGIACFV